MIDRAVLYLADPDDVAWALRRIAGRPVAFHSLAAALRAGVREVGIPAVLGDGALADAVAASGEARRRVTWLDPGTAPPAGPLLLLPATTLVSTAAVAAVTAGGPGTALDGTGDLALVLAAPPPLVGTLWTALARGEPLGRALAAEPARPWVSVDGSAQAWAVPVRTAEAARRAEATLGAILGSPIDTWIDRTVHRRLSRPVSGAAVGLGVTPNQLSLVALAVGLGAAWCMAQGTIPWGLAGLALYLGAVVLDHADGEVARLALQESRLGAWLDVAVDTAIHAAVVAAMGGASAELTGRGATAGALAAGGIVASAVVAKVGAIGPGSVGTALHGLGNRDGFYALLAVWLLLLAVAPAWLPALLAVVAAGAHVYWLGRLASWRGRRNTARKPK